VSAPISERRVVFLVGAVQFVNILDFMIVMPMGPDFALALGIDSSHLGYIGGSYTAAAAVSGLIAALFLDRFDRRKALAVAMAGLVVGTAAGALARGLGTLMAARILAGMFGGPATSIALSIIADLIPPSRRGKAMGAIMSAFAVASVLGVPAGLELARRGGWRLPFLSVALLGLVVTGAAIFMLPPLRLHLERKARLLEGKEYRDARLEKEREPRVVDLFNNPVVLLSYAMTITVMMGSFILIPNLSAYTQFNLGYPRARLGFLYMAGGAVSFFAVRIIGRLVDTYGAFRVGTVGSILLGVVVYFGFVDFFLPIPVMALFVAFMLAMQVRNVSYNTLTTMVPRPAERARFMSVQSSVQHFASASGAFLSSKMLHELPDKRLAGMPRVAAVTLALTATLPFMLYVVETRVRKRDAIARAAGEDDAPVSLTIA
jgi:predicted MFS family arabinose efflux permease